MYAAIVPIINIVMLLMAAFQGFPSYGYYLVLRGLTVFTSLFGAFIFHCTPSKKHLQYVYLFMALLFNPIVPVRLGRSLWQRVDVIAALLLIYMFYFVLKDSNVSFVSAKTFSIGLSMIALSVVLITNGRIVAFSFMGLAYLFAALLMTFATYAMGSLSIGHWAEKKEIPAVVLPLVFAVISTAAALHFWAACIRALGKI